MLHLHKNLYRSCFSFLPLVKPAVLATVGIAILFESKQANAQYAFEQKNEAGAVTYIHYSGGSDWLVAQADPKSHWHRLPELTDLMFNNCMVSREALRYVLSLKSLRGLDLGEGPEGIEIYTDDLELLEKADLLEYLGLCFADITNEHLRFLPEMDNLASVDICSLRDFDRKDSFTDELARLLVATPKLRSIKIHSENFTDEFVRILSARRDLEDLDIASPHFTDASLDILGKLPELRRLRLRAPLITDEGFAHLITLGSLEELEIESPKLGSRSLSIAAGLSRLTLLVLSIDKVRAEDLARVQNLKSLKILALRKNPIGDGEFSGLRDHPSIESLFFEQAQLTEKSLPVIASMKKLKHVDFSTKTEATRRLLQQISERGIKDHSFYPKPK